MNRRGFLKILGISASAPAIAQADKILTAPTTEIEKVEPIIYEYGHIGIMQVRVVKEGSHWWEITFKTRQKQWDYINNTTMYTEYETSHNTVPRHSEKIVPGGMWNVIPVTEYNTSAELIIGKNTINIPIVWDKENNSFKSFEYIIS